MERKRKLYKESLADQVYRILLEDIVRSRYPQGSRIDIESLEKELHISRIPIRDALQILTEKGLVQKIPRVGFFIAKFTKEDVEDLFRVRTFFEDYSISFGFENIDRELLVYLKNRYEKLSSKSELSNKDIKELFELESKFHQDLLIGNGNSALIKKFYSEIDAKVKMYSHLVFRLNQDISEHLKIINAIMDNDKKKALEFLNDHFETVLKKINDVVFKDQ